MAGKRKESNSLCSGKVSPVAPEDFAAMGDNGKVPCGRLCRKDMIRKEFRDKPDDYRYNVNEVIKNSREIKTEMKKYLLD